MPGSSPRTRRTGTGARCRGRSTATPWTRAEYLPGLEKHIPRKRPELVGLGRNVDTFDWLRHHAYREIRLWRDSRDRQGVYVRWLTYLYERAQNFTHDTHPNPLDHRETHHIAKSVARWVWRNCTAEYFSAKQAARGRLGGLKGGVVERSGAKDCHGRERCRDSRGHHRGGPNTKLRRQTLRHS